MKQFLEDAISLCCKASVYNGIFGYKRGTCNQCKKRNGYSVPGSGTMSAGYPISSMSRNLS